MNPFAFLIGCCIGQTLLLAFYYFTGLIIGMWHDSDLYDEGLTLPEYMLWHFGINIMWWTIVTFVLYFVLNLLGA